MIAAVHQLHYLPWLRYLEKMVHTDVFIVLDNIQYNKNGWQNRNRIKGPRGPMLLSVPVLDRFAQNLDEVRIDNTSRWRKKHWESIRQCYSKAPHFHSHAPFLESVYQQDWDFLNELNRHMLGYFVEALGIRTRILYASELKVPGCATERLINLIRVAGCDTYYSGAYALEAYLDETALSGAGIALQLQHWKSFAYPQQHGAFVPDLSVLDLLLNCGPASLDRLRGREE